MCPVPDPATQAAGASDTFNPGVPLITTTIRLESELYNAIQAEAERLGVSASEYIRSSIRARYAWDTAVRAIQAGLPPGAALDTEQLIAHIAAATHQLRRGTGGPFPPPND